MKTLGFISTTQAYQLQFGRLSSGTVRAKKTAQNMTPVVTYEEAFKALSLRPHTILQEAERIFERFHSWLEKAEKGTPAQLYWLKNEKGESINSTVMAQSQYVTQEELYLLELVLLQKIRESVNVTMIEETINPGGMTITIGRWVAPSDALWAFINTKEAEKYCWAGIDIDGDPTSAGCCPRELIDHNSNYKLEYIRCIGPKALPGEEIDEDED